MKLLDYTFDRPEYNLACDEALLDLCEETESDEVLRFWEPLKPFVVLGYSGKIRSEVNLEACRLKQIPVLRRASGGGTVLQGPGCLNFSLILNLKRSKHLKKITDANRFIMKAHQKALNPLLGRRVTLQGFTDLAFNRLKFSGNAQRRKRRFLLFHGTFLLHFNITPMERLLPIPARQPAYRKNRPHSSFLTNIPLTCQAVKTALKNAWDAREMLAEIPELRIEALARARYGTDEWNHKF